MAYRHRNAVSLGIQRAGSASRLSWLERASTATRLAGSLAKAYRRPAGQVPCTHRPGERQWHDVVDLHR